MSNAIPAYGLWTLVVVNSGLASSEYFMPVMGLSFLRHAANRDQLFEAPPTPPFTPEEKEEAARKVYQHVWRRAASERHQSADQSYLEDGVRLFELAQNAQRLFAKQDAREKRRLLNFLVSNCSWRDGELTATLRQPFDLIAETTAIDAKRKAAGEVSNGLSEIWLRRLDSNQRPDD